MATITPREFLRKNGFTVGDRGRFNAEQLAFLAEKGFDVTVPTAKPKTDKSATESEGSKIRAWAVENGITVNARGKLSTALKAAYAANDPELANPTVEIKVRKNRAGEPKTDSQPVVSGWVAKPTISSPVIRDTNEAFAIGADGLVIAFSTCGHCKESVSRCACEMPKPVGFVAKLMPECTVSLERPEKLRHEKVV